MRHQLSTILTNIFIVILVFIQAGCGATSPTAQEQTPGAGNAATAVQTISSPPVISLTATATASPTQPTTTPTQTPTASPSPTPAWQPYSGILTSGKQETVSSSSIDTATPSDILPKITVTRLFQAKDCLKRADLSTAAAFETSEMLQKAKQMDAPVLLSCGWNRSDSVKITIRYPDGRENTKTILATKKSRYDEPIFSASTFYQITLDDPPGVYTFIAENGKERTETQLLVEKTYYTLGPRVFAVYDDPFAANYHLFDQDQVLLYGFGLNEPVRLLLYHGTKQDARNDYYYFYRFVGSQQVVTGPDGNLVIRNEIPEANYWVAIGETSGTVAESFYEEAGSLKPPSGFDVQCPVILPTRLSNNTTIRVTKVDTQKIRVRKEPGFHKEIVGEIPEGTEMWPQGDPQCADQTWWWPVAPAFVNVRGWVAEADPEEYILEPAD